MRLLSAKSEELEGLREGEPVHGAPSGSGDGGAVDAVPQDVAEETARAVAEASGEDVGSGSGTGSGAGSGSGSGGRPTGGSGGSGSSGGSGDGGAEGESGADVAAVDPNAETQAFPARRERHTPLYGRGKRILPWKHKARLAPPQRRRRKIVVRSLWGCVLVVCGTVGWSIAGALTSPGTDTVQARLAEWGRDHGLGGVVSTLEKWQYDLDPPKKGGTVDARQFSDLGPTTAAPGQQPAGQADQVRLGADQVRRRPEPGS